MADKQLVNSSRVHLRTQVRRFSRRTKPGMLVLDAGAGTSPYRRFFSHATFETADFAQVDKDYGDLDYVCDLTDIPVEEGRFDRVLFNQVLEHLPEPAKALAELHRVLRPGGLLFCSVPLFYAEHEQPHDYFRYTQFALRRLFEEAGFRIERIDWLEGYFGTVSYQFREMSRHLPADPRALRGLGMSRAAALRAAPTLRFTRWLAGRLQRFYAELDVDHKYTAAGMPKNYVVVARKPRSREGEAA